MKSKYQLTIRYNIDAIDDIDARIQAKDIMDTLHDEFDVKLQRVFTNKKPEKVEL